MLNNNDRYFVLSTERATPYNVNLGQLPLSSLNTVLRTAFIFILVYRLLFRIRQQRKYT